MIKQIANAAAYTQPRSPRADSFAILSTLFRTHEGVENDFEKSAMRPRNQLATLTLSILRSLTCPSSTSLTINSEDL